MARVTLNAIIDADTKKFDAAVKGAQTGLMTLGKATVLGDLAIGAAGATTQLLSMGNQIVQAGQALGALSFAGILLGAQAFSVLKLAMNENNAGAKQLKDTWQQMNNDFVKASASVLPGLNAGLKNASALVPTLSKGLSDTGRVLGDLATRAGSVVASPLFKRDIGNIMRDNTVSMRNFGDAGITLLHPLRDLAAVAAKVLMNFSGFAEMWANQFADMIEAKRASGELEKSFRDGAKALIDFVAGVWAFGGIIKNVMEAAGIASGDTMGKLSGWLRELKKNTDEGTPAFHKMVEAFRKFNEKGRELWELLKKMGNEFKNVDLEDLADAFIKLTESAGLLTPVLIILVNAFADLINAIPQPVLTALIAIFISLKFALLGLKVIQGIATMVQAFGTAWGVVMTIFSRVAPLFGIVGEKLALLAGWIGRIVGPAVRFVVAFSRLGVVANIIRIAFMALVTVISATVGSVAVAIGIIIAVVLAVIAVIVLLVIYWDQVWNQIKNIAGTIWRWLQMAWDVLMGAILWAWNNLGLKELWDGTWNTIKIIASTIWNILQVAWDVFLNVMKIAWETFSGVVSTLWEAFWGAIKTVAQGIWDAIQVAWDIFLGVIKGVWDVIAGIFTADWSRVWEGIKAIGDAIWKGMQALWDIFLGVLMNLWNIFRNSIAEAWNIFWGGIKAVASEIWQGMQAAWDIFLNGIKAAYHSFVDTFKEAWNVAWGTVKQVAVDIWEGIKAAFWDFCGFFINAWNGFVGALYTAWNASWSWVKDTASTIWNALQIAWDAVLKFFYNIFDGWRSTLQDAWRNAWEFVKQIATDIWQALQVAWNAFCGFFIGIWNTVSSALTTAWNTVWNALSTAAQAVWNFLSGVWNAFINGLIAIWNTVSSALSASWNTIWNAIRTVAETIWNAIRTAWETILNALRTAWETFANFIRAAWEGFQRVATAVWTFIKDTAIRLWNELWDALKGAWEAFAGFIRDAWEGMKRVASEVWTWIKDTAIRLWNELWDAIRGAWETFASWIRDAWEGMKRVVSEVWTTIKDTASRLWNELWDAVKIAWEGFAGFIREAFDGFKRVALRIFQETKDGIKAIWDGITKVIGTPVHFVLKTVINDGILKGINWILEKLPGDLSIPLIPNVDAIPHLASGGKIRGPGGPREDKVPAWLSNGEYVVNAAATSKNLSLLENINAGGVMGMSQSRPNDMVPRFPDGGLLGTGIGPDVGPEILPEIPGANAATDLVANTVGNIVEKVEEWARAGLAKGAELLFDNVAKPLISHRPPGPGMNEKGDILERAGHGIFFKLRETVVGYIRDEENKMMASTFGAVYGGDIGKVIDAARTRIGTPYSWGGGGPSGPSEGFAQGAGIIGFDCSSLMQYAFKQGANINLPRVTTQQEMVGHDIAPNATRAGDMLFYGSRGATHHVALQSGGNDMIEAQQTGTLVHEVVKRMPDFGRRVIDEALVLLSEGVAAGPVVEMAKAWLDKYGWGGQFPSFNTLEMREAAWDIHATNSSSGAYGLAQALPPTKYGTLESGGPNPGDWRNDANVQLRWMMDYIKVRYRDPNGALAFHMANNYYAKGGMVDEIQPGQKYKAYGGITWGEGHGGEAYIPLGAGQRSNSMKLLGAVANKFGMSLTPKGVGNMINMDHIANAAASASGTSSNNTGSITISMPITVNGNLDEKAAKKLDQETIPKIRMMLQQGVGRRH